ncbi:chromate transporter [Paraliomyxa miuraensis]|uniref:chromate transporter n=1 Tax=Paraliomyxa miuraensis TaxID=376150 RepID=UPI0022516A11|nr:chromate transporter [Paraliomyxa miuraensis]MCX4246251.1 chromate transporter [Paraliomyxa miuraensis]
MSLPLLTWQFFVLSFVAFGSVTSVLPELHRAFVESSQLMTDEQFAGLFAMSQAAPGTNAMFVTVFGWQLAGSPGALCATAAFCCPPAVIAVSLERFGRRFREARWNGALRRAVAPITVGLLLSSGFLLVRSTPTLGGILLALAAVGVFTLTKLTPLWLTAIGAIVGALGLV